MSYYFRPLMAAALIALATPVFAETVVTPTVKAPEMSAPAKTDKATPSTTTTTTAGAEKKADAVTPAKPDVKADAKAPDAGVKSSATDTKDKVASNETGMTKRHHKMVKEEAAKGDAKSDPKTGATVKTETPATK